MIFSASNTLGSNMGDSWRGVTWLLWEESQKGFSKDETHELIEAMIR